jgi:anthrone oxygenase-like protein
MEATNVTIRLIFNVLAVCGTAAFTGALLTIGLTLGSHWKSLSPEAFLDWFSTNSHFIGRTLPVCLAATLLGLTGSLWLGWPDVQQRYLWGGALVCVLGLLVITAVYNGPMNSQFASKSVSPDQIPGALNMWLTLHAVRVALGVIASVVGVVAVSRRVSGETSPIRTKGVIPRFWNCSSLATDQKPASAATSEA